MQAFLGVGTVWAADLHPCLPTLPAAPGSLSALTRLTALDLAHNVFTSFEGVEGWSTLTSLARLDLSSCEESLAQVPDVLQVRAPARRSRQRVPCLHQDARFACMPVVPRAARPQRAIAASIHLAAALHLAADAAAGGQQHRRACGCVWR